MVDTHVGHILDTLAVCGLEGNTIVVYTSDHGDMMGSHRLLAKCVNFEEAVRVPQLVRLPGQRDQVCIPEPVSQVDLVPTLLEVVGLPVPDRVQGRSLRPILEGRADPHHHRDFVRSVYFETLQGPPTRATMIRTRRHKLVNYHGHGLGELYDLEADPGEFDNLWDDPRHADVRFELVARSFDALAFAVDTGSERVGRY